MYGTISRLKPKPGQEAAVISMIDEWDQTRAPLWKGSGVGYLYRPDQSPDELIMVVAFRDKESYRANAEDPEQDRWYRRFRDLLQADPTWEDGEIIYSTDG